LPSWPISLTCFSAGFGQILAQIGHEKTHADLSDGGKKLHTPPHTHTHIQTLGQPARQFHLLFLFFCWSPFHAVFSGFVSGFFTASSTPRKSRPIRSDPRWPAQIQVKRKHTFSAFSATRK